MTKLDADSLLEDFKDEAKGHIEKIESAFLDTEALVGDPGLIGAVFRAAHSLKGTAGFFSLGKIVAVAHEMESLFSRIKDNEIKPDDKLADAALACVDTLRALVDNIRSQDTIEIGDLLARLKAYTGGKIPADERIPARTPLVTTALETNDLLKKAVKRGRWLYSLSIGAGKALGEYAGRPAGLADDILSVSEVLAAAVGDAEAEAKSTGALARIITGAAGGKTPPLELLVSSVLEPELFLIAVELDSRYVRNVSAETVRGEKTAAGGTVSRQSERADDFYIRLDVTAVDALMDLANEMILTRNRLLARVTGHERRIAGLAPVLLEVNRLTGEIQEKVMRARMQPVNVLFGKFPRIIRDMAKALGKDIRIEIHGGDVALDKYLLDSLSDPVTQIVKNSADHGIENPAVRAASGKPERGLISLKAYLREGFAFVDISDDGAGIDVEALKRKSVELGLVSEEKLASMSKAELSALIFEPGLSTAKQVTNVSGRGVGMDIVRENIVKLGGSIEVDSEPGRGTVIRIKTPLSLSVTRTLVVRAAGAIYAVPEINVERLVRISRGETTKLLERVNNSLMLNLNGWIIPVVTFGSIDARAGGVSPPCPDDLPPRADISKCLVLKSGAGESGNRYFALLIDDAVSTEETVIKPLPVFLRGCGCYSGVAVLGGGDAVMILDAEGIMRFMDMSGVEKPPAEEIECAGDIKQVVVFKCSGAEHFAVDADKIRRIERISPGDIQEVGEGAYVNISGQTVRVIRPEDYAPVQKREYPEKPLYLLVLDAGAAPAAVLAGRVLDKVGDVFSPETGLVANEYVFGTCAYGEKVLIFLNTENIMRSLPELPANCEKAV